MKTQRNGWRVMAAAALLSLAGCATVQYPFQVDDARTHTRFGDARTTVRGAEVTLADDALSPTLVDRLAKTLHTALGDAATGRVLRVERAMAVLVVDNARVSPRTYSQAGNMVPILRDAEPSALKHITVDYAGTLDGKPFVGHGEEHYRLGDGGRELSRAIEIAAKAAVNDALQGATKDAVSR